jgi:hypothetical protein
MRVKARAARPNCIGNLLVLSILTRSLPIGNHGRAHFRTSFPRFGGVMQYARLYATEDGETHFEDIDISLSPVDLAPPAPLFNVSSSQECDAFSFVHLPAGWYGEAHPAPRRLLWVLLDGDLEVQTSDGEARRFTQGDVLLADDTTGKGHVSRISAETDLRAVTVTVRS